MKSIVDALNKKTGENAKTVVEALKDVDPNATGNTIAEVIETMEIGGGGGGEDFGVANLLVTNQTGETLEAMNIIDGSCTDIANNETAEIEWILGNMNGTYSAIMFFSTSVGINAFITNGNAFKLSNYYYGSNLTIFMISADGDITEDTVEILISADGGVA